ncbi:MAG TPA: GTPase Era [Thermodesulfobacteriota bacterium]|nr:GTPase Era [Thermodesulfobacteriota bacterium]
MIMTSFKSGFISILGMPNVGKSTLFNRLLGDKIAIIAEKPQTTRNRILGIRNMEGGQLIFLDTPGIHQGRSELNQRMVRTAIASARDADILLYLIEAAFPRIEKDQEVIGSLKECRGIPILVINKMDRVKRKNLLPIMDQYQKLYPFKEIFPVSALTGEGIDVLLKELMKSLPESPPYYPKDVVTDQTERFWVSEIIREKVIRQSYEEIPYSTAVTIEEFKEHPERNLVVIKGIVHVERDSQKKILIGKCGQKLKKIGEAARKEAEALLGMRVFLDLWVNVERNWTQDPGALNRLGYPSASDFSS